MAKRDFFRVSDRVSVHDFGLARAAAGPGCDTVIARGRVICTNRKSRHGLCVVVLVDLPHGEMVETFTLEGKRPIPRDKCHITLGWPKV